MTILGLHHITLGCSDAQQTIDFYTGILGLRFVKRTINFDDPGTYHLYFGDQAGSPGSAVTFFEWPGVPKGHPGIGGTHHFALTVPNIETVNWWKDRLEILKIAIEGPYEIADGQEICFRDPDGVIVKLTSDANAIPRSSAEEDISAIPSEMALSHGMHHITAFSSDLARTDAFYQGLLGLTRLSELPSHDQPGQMEWAWGHESGTGGEIRYAEMNPANRKNARIGAGQTHHFAFAVADDDVQEEWQHTLVSAGLSVSPVMNRMYFKSIYTRDPDGHVVELATAGPGFDADEDAAHLGETLKLPPWLEGQREGITARLRTITIPEQGGIS
jgi:glyoxalase family protein